MMQRNAATAAAAAMVVLLLCGPQLHPIRGQGCLQNTPEYGGGGGLLRLANGNLYLIPAYTFSCHGNVTQWRAYVKTGGGQDIFNIMFYVFRPSTDSTLPNCYFLVGIDRLVDAAPTGSSVILDVSIDQLPVQPGDVVGVLPMSNEVESGIKTDVTLSGVAAWYIPKNSIIAGDAMCPYKSAPDGNLPRLALTAPLITAAVVPFPVSFSLSTRQIHSSHSYNYLPTTTQTPSPFISPAPSPSSFYSPPSTSSSLSTSSFSILQFSASHSSTQYSQHSISTQTPDSPQSTAFLFPDGPLSTTIIIAGITVGGAGGVVVLLLLAVFCTILIRKRLSLKRGNSPIRFTFNNSAFKATVPANADSNYMVTNEVYRAAHFHSQKIDTHRNEAYQKTATVDPTEHIETHGNEAYQTTASAISTQPNSAYVCQVNNEHNYEEIADYYGRVDQDDHEEYAMLRYQ